MRPSESLTWSEAAEVKRRFVGGLDAYDAAEPWVRGDLGRRRVSITYRCPTCRLRIASVHQPLEPAHRERSRAGAERTGAIFVEYSSRDVLGESVRVHADGTETITATRVRGLLDESVWTPTSRRFRLVCTPCGVDAQRNADKVAAKLDRLAEEADRIGAYSHGVTEVAT